MNDHPTPPATTPSDPALPALSYPQRAALYMVALAAKGRVDAFRTLLDDPAVPKEKHLDAALEVAIHSGNVDMVPDLVDAGAALWKCEFGRDDAQKSPLLVAVENNNPALIDRILRYYRKEANIYQQWELQTALEHAATHNYGKVFDSLIDKGIALGVSTSLILQAACSGRNYSIIEKFIDKVPLNADSAVLMMLLPNKEDKTLLADRGTVEGFKRIHAQLCDIHGSSSAMAFFALQQAACIDSPQAAAIVDYLLKAGTETSFRGDPGQNLLFLAAFSGSTKTIDVLLNFFKGTDISDDVRQKAFNAAAVRLLTSDETGHPVDNLAEGFFRLNNDFDLARFAPEALRLAVEKAETPDGLRALLDNISENKAKALVAAQPNLLKMAVRAQDAEKVRLLCKAGADPLALCDDNPTWTIMEEALNLPRTETRMEIINVLAEQILTRPLIQPTTTPAPRRARPG